MQNDIQSPQTPTKVPLYGKLLILFAAICIVLLAVLAMLNNTNDQKQSQQTPPPKSTTSIATEKIAALKTQAFEKLHAGDKQGGLNDLRAALSLAKDNKLTADIRYFEQQIDYAENTEFTTAKQAAPATSQSEKGKPGYVSR